MRNNGTIENTPEMQQAMARSMALPVLPDPPPKHMRPEPTPYTAEWDERLYEFGASFVLIWGTLGLIRALSVTVAKFAFGFWRFAWRGWTMGRTVIGGQVGDDEYAERMGQCQDCAERVDVKWKQYCGPCRCPHWLLSRLDNKNRFRRWRCPEGKHAGSVKRKCIGCG